MVRPPVAPTLGARIEVALLAAFGAPQANAMPLVEELLLRISLPVCRNIS